MYSSKINIKLCGILYNYTDYSNTYIWFYFEVFDGWMGDRKNDKFFLNSIENYDSIGIPKYNFCWKMYQNIGYISN